MTPQFNNQDICCDINKTNQGQLTSCCKKWDLAKTNIVHLVNYKPVFYVSAFMSVPLCQCFDTVGWAAGRASGL